MEGAAIRRGADRASSREGWGIRPRLPGGSARAQFHASSSDPADDVIVGAPWPTRP